MLDALEVTAQAGYWIEFGKRFGVIAERKVVSRKLLVRSKLLQGKAARKSPFALKTRWISEGAGGFCKGPSNAEVCLAH